MTIRNAENGSTKDQPIHEGMRDQMDFEHLDRSLELTYTTEFAVLLVYGNDFRSSITKVEVLFCSQF